MSKYVIIVAGGTGSRMQSALPKQFIVINQRPIIFHTIDKFLEYSDDIKIIIAIQKEYFTYWRDLCKTYHFEKEHQLIEAGTARYFTVKNALKAISDTTGIVAIHDAVRPMVSVKTIKRCFDQASQTSNAIPTIPLIDSIRQVSANKNKSVHRENYVSVQTPQCFRLSLIKKAYELPYKPTYTDDASVVEALGEEIHLVQGNTKNKKITTPIDLLVAEYTLKKHED